MKPRWVHYGIKDGVTVETLCGKRVSGIRTGEVHTTTSEVSVTCPRCLAELNLQGKAKP